MPRSKGKQPELTAAQKAEREKAKRTKFVEIVNARGNKAYKAIGLLRNLANASKYTFTVDDINALLKPLNAQLDGVTAAFEAALKGGAVKTDNAIQIK